MDNTELSLEKMNEISTILKENYNEPAKMYVGTLLN